MLTGEYEFLIDNIFITNIIAIILLLVPLILLFFDIRWLYGLYTISIIANLPLIFFIRFNFSYEIIIGFALLLKIIINMFKKKSFKFITAQDNIFLFLSLFLIIALNLVLSLLNFNYTQYIIRLIVYFVNIFVFVVFVYYIDNLKTLNTIKSAVMIGAVILLFSMIIELIYGYYYLGMSNMRISGLLLDPNVCAFALNLCLVISFVETNNISFAKSIGYIVLRLLFVFGVFLTVSRAGYIETAIIMIYMFFHYLRKEAKWIPFTIVTVFTFTIIIFYSFNLKFWLNVYSIIDLKRILPLENGLSPGIQAPLSPSEPSSIQNERIILLITTGRIFIHNFWTGVGIGNVIPHMSAYTGIGLNSHNMILQLLAESGIIMVFAIILFGYFLIRLLVNANADIRWLLILLSLIIGFESLFNHNLLNINIIWFIFAFLAAINTIYSKHHKKFSLFFPRALIN